MYVPWSLVVAGNRKGKLFSLRQRLHFRGLKVALLMATHPVQAEDEKRPPTKFRSISIKTSIGTF